MNVAVLRRVVLPVWLAVAAALIAVAPVVAGLARAAGAVTRRREPATLARLLYVYLFGELAILAGVVRGRPIVALLDRFLADLSRTAMHGFALRLDLEADEAALAALAARDRPLLVFSRHAGAGDSVLILHLLLCRFGREPRIVMKEVLALDPAVGLVVDRLPSALVRPGADDGDCEAIEAVARGMGDDAALLLFPEGGNFSVSRRAGAIRWLRRQAEHLRARRAEGLEHLLSPRTGGVLAALAGAPGADVIFVAHTGLGRAAKGLELLRGLPQDGTVRIRLWHAAAADHPQDETGRIEWLDAWWARLDAWVAASGTD